MDEAREQEGNTLSPMSGNTVIPVRISMLSQDLCVQQLQVLPVTSSTSMNASQLVGGANRQEASHGGPAAETFADLESASGDDVIKNLTHGGDLTMFPPTGILVVVLWAASQLLPFTTAPDMAAQHPEVTGIARMLCIFSFIAAILGLLVAQPWFIPTAVSKLKTSNPRVHLVSSVAAQMLAVIGEASVLGGWITLVWTSPYVPLLITLSAICGIGVFAVSGYIMVILQPGDTSSSPEGNTELP